MTSFFDELIEVNEAAEMLQVQPVTIRRYVREGLDGVRLRSYTVGGHRKFLPEDLQEFVVLRAEREYNNGRISA